MNSLNVRVSNRLARSVIAKTIASAAVVVASIVPLPASAAVINLATYNVDINDTSVSGLSSGAYMAVQMHIAFSSIMKGAGIIAGGPYNCGGQNAFGSCMFLSSPNVAPLILETRNRSGSSIDDVSNLANHKIFMFSGGNDFTVSKTVMDKLYQYYTTAPALVPAGNILYVPDHIPASGHTFPTNFGSPGNEACTTATDFPWISNCNYDAAGTLLEHIYGRLNARNNGALGGEFVEFNQAEFMPAGVDPRTNGMDDSGWMYVPASCKPVSQGGPGQACKLHIAFHGCHQFHEHADLIEGVFGDKFTRNTGYNKWADPNNIIVLYPQTVRDTVNHNPKPSQAGANQNGCWDWVGYYGTNFDTREGVQIAAIKKMIDRIAGGNGDGNGVAAPTNLGVSGTTSNSASLSWTASSGPDVVGYNVYSNGTKVNGSLVTATSYNDTGLTANTGYSYYVKAVNTSNVESAASNTVTACTGTCATTVSFNSIAGDDGYVKANADGTSPAVGILPTLAIGRGTDGKYNRTILSFDTSSIPDGATITRAYFTVAHSSSSGDPWANPAGNPLLVDVKNGTFGAATTEAGDWGSVPNATAVASIAKFTSGITQSSDFSAAGRLAINKTGRTQLKLRFANNQTATNYIFISEGASARLTVEYQ